MCKTPLGRSAAKQYSQTTYYFTIYSCLCQTKRGIVYNKFKNAVPYYYSIPYFGHPVEVFSNFCHKKFGPAGKLPCGTLIRRKKKRTGNHIHPTAEKFGENCPADIRRRFPKFLPYITRRHLLLNGSSGIVWACLPCPRRTSLPLRGK